MTLLYFTAPWCAPCKTFGPVLDTVVSAPVVRIDVEGNEDWTRRYEVRSLPTVIAVRPDGSEIKRFSGARDLAFVNAFIKSIEA